MSSGCLFCRIVAGEIPSKRVYEDDTLIAFEDINPQAPGHVLVVPRRHIASLNDLKAPDDQLVGELIRRGAALAADMGFADRGYRAVFNTNADGTLIQSVQVPDGVLPAVGAVTVEPDGGSPQPTSTPILAGQWRDVQ